MVGPVTEPGSARTRLFFGSAVVPSGTSSRSGGGMGPVFTAVLGFHKLYSRALLSSASARLSAQAAGPAHVHGNDA